MNPTPWKMVVWMITKIIEAPITSLTKTALEGIELDNKSIVRCKNMFALGMMYWLFDRDSEETVKFLAD